MIVFILMMSSLVFASEKATVNASEAMKYAGQTITVCDNVDDVKHFHDKGVYFVNFDGQWPDNKFTIVIWERDAHIMQIDPVSEFLGKHVCVNEKIDTYNRKPQVTLTTDKNVTVSPRKINE